MSLEIIQPAFIMTVQDRGRHGYSRFGLPASGPMDPYAFKMANNLVGNTVEAAGLEFVFSGTILKTQVDCLIAVTGRGGSLKVGEKEFLLWMSVLVRKNQLIEITRNVDSGWIYLAIAGGIRTPITMESRSTYLPGKIGGLDGSVLKEGDILPTGNPVNLYDDLTGRYIPLELQPLYSDRPCIDVILGPDDDRFTESGIQTFLSNEYAVSMNSDRMGYRLSGPRIEHKAGADMISSGMVFGSVQVPQDGEPIVMMSDHPTSGGYTKIATVINADLPLLAQCPLGTGKIRFRQTTVEAAQLRYREMVKRMEKSIVEPDDNILVYSSF